VLLKHAIKGRSSNIWLGDKAALNQGSILWADNQGLKRWKLRVAGAVVMGVRRSCLRWQRAHKSTALITRLTLKRAINHTSSMRWPHKTANFEECTPPDFSDSFVSQSFGFLDTTSGFRTSEYTLLASSLRSPFAWRPMCKHFTSVFHISGSELLVHLKEKCKSLLKLNYKIFWSLKGCSRPKNDI